MFGILMYRYATNTSSDWYQAIGYRLRFIPLPQRGDGKVCRLTRESKTKLYRQAKTKVGSWHIHILTTLLVHTHTLAVHSTAHRTA